MSEVRKGELFLAGEIFLWSFFPVITVLSYGGMSPFVSLGWSSLVAGLFFGAIVWYKGLFHELYSLAFWLNVLLTTLFIGVLYYGCYFAGLAYTSAGNASIIALFEIFTSYLVFNVWKGDSFRPEYAWGAFLMVFGALLIVCRDISAPNIGDMLVLLGTFFAPIGNYFQQRARKFASSESILFIRQTVAGLVALAAAASIGQPVATEGVWHSSLFILVNGVLLLGLSKYFWIEAIHRISTTKACALGTLATFGTLCIAWLVLGQVPAWWQLLSLPPMILGVLLLTNVIVFSKKSLSLS